MVTNYYILKHLPETNVSGGVLEDKSLKRAERLRRSGPFQIVQPHR